MQEVKCCRYNAPTWPRDAGPFVLVRLSWRPRGWVALALERALRTETLAARQIVRRSSARMRSCRERIQPFPARGLSEFLKLWLRFHSRTGTAFSFDRHPWL